MNQTLAGLNQAPAVRGQKSSKDVRACEHTAKGLQAVIRACERTAKGLQAVIRACEHTVKGLQAVIRAYECTAKGLQAVIRACEHTAKGLQAVIRTCGPENRCQGLLVTYPFDVGDWLEINYWLSAGLRVQGT